MSQTKQSSTNIKERLQPYFEDARSFHGYLSPGIVLGIIMVDLAKELLGPRKLIDAVVETQRCIPDAIQLMTACTYGNGWMRVKDWGKLALTLYDKEKLDGIRVFLNPREVKKYPLIQKWHMKIGDVDKGEAAREIISAGRNILSWQKVTLIPYKRGKKAPISFCYSCGEAHPASDGDLCARCSGKDNYYKSTNGLL